MQGVKDKEVIAAELAGGYRGARTERGTAVRCRV